MIDSAKVLYSKGNNDECYTPRYVVEAILPFIPKDKVIWCPIETFEKLKNEGIILHHIDIEKSPFALKANYKALKQLRRIIDNENINLIHCHNPMGAVTARLAAKCSHKNPYVMYTAHGFHFYQGAPVKNWLLFYMAEKFLARYTNAIITINKEDYERAQKFHLKKDGIVGQIYGVGVNLDRFKKMPEKNEQIRKQIDIPQDAFHIVTAAEINTNKNQKVIIEAIGALKRDDIFYSICGKGNNIENLKKLVHEKNLDRYFADRRLFCFSVYKGRSWDSSSRGTGNGCTTYSIR